MDEQENQAACAGSGTDGCVDMRAEDRRWCARWREFFAAEPGTAREWSLALRLHDGDAAARAEVAERFAMLTEYLMLRGGTDFVDACREHVAAGKWSGLVGRICALEDDLVRNEYLRRDDNGRATPAKPGMRIPEHVVVIGPLFQEASAT